MTNFVIGMFLLIIFLLIGLIIYLIRSLVGGH